jgi:signal transduction histidine kinase
LLAVLVFRLTSLWWVALVSAWPGPKPYIGGSTDGSVLNLVIGYNGLGRRGGARTPAEVELLTGRIEAEATRMGVLVEDLLLLAQLDQERALDITDVDLLVLAADAVHDASAREPDRPVSLSPGSGAVHVLGDEHKLRQVVTNLITNALTHTPAAPWCNWRSARMPPDVGPPSASCCP